LRIKAPKNFRNRSSGVTRYQKVKLCTAKRTNVPVRPAKLDANWCNESPLRG